MTSPVGRGLLSQAVLLLAFAAAGCGGDKEGDSPKRGSGTLNSADFSARVDHPLVPLSSVRFTVLRGREEGSESRAAAGVLGQTDRVAGVPVAVVEVKDYENGELVERTLDYYAQRDDGSVWYFGERVDNYEKGKVVDHEGQWLAGRSGARPGLFMPAKPKVGQTFEQERAPGVAEDRSTVAAVGLKLTTPAGKFDDCIKTKDYAPLDKVTELKYYCSGVGLVREDLSDGRVDLVRYR